MAYSGQKKLSEYEKMVERSYKKINEPAELGIFKTKANQKRFLILLGIALIYPFIFGTYWTGIMNFALIMAIAAIGLNIVTGHSGQLSVGQGALMGFGAITAFLLAKVVAFSHLPVILIAGLVSALIGTIIGTPAIRIATLYLAAITICLQLVFDWFFIGVFGGAHITAYFPKLNLGGGLTISSEPEWYYFLLAITALSMWTVANLNRSYIGRAFSAVRDNQVAANILGVNLTKYKILAFSLSGFYGGMAGGLWGFYNMHIAPEHFKIWQSIWILAMIMIGGMGRVWGGVIGAILLTFLLEGFRGVFTELTGSFIPAEYSYMMFGMRWIIIGFAIIFVIVHEPYGLVDLIQKVKNRYGGKFRFLNRITGN